MSKSYLATIYLLAGFLTFGCQPDDKQQQEDSRKTQVSEHETVVKSIAESELPEEVSDLPDAAEFESDYPAEIPTGRLPELARPTMYWLNLSIDPDQDTFSGSVKINVELETPTQHLWIHGKDITAQSVEAKLSSGESIKGTYQEVDPTGVAKIGFKQPLPAGNFALTIIYQAPFNESLEGLYRVNDGGLNYAFSQFEATSARLAFPGFDEPAFKVPFNYTIRVRTNHKAFTNTPAVTETNLDNGWKEIVYARSKPMPTYLVAFAVGDLDVVEWKAIPTTDVRDREIPLRGIATKGKGKKLTYALENTKDILNSLEEYFQIPYPYAKLDIVAVPDFNFGAMENVGLIIYREQLLLFDDTISLDQKRAYMNVHAHELAHQWFGNLVTPVWWDDIWLNEAFATWMAHVSNNNLYPEQKFRQTLLERSLGAMRQDSLINARQIRQPIKSNHDIQSAFDGITYSKGGGVLSMIESFMTPEEFRAGIQHYMKKHEFGTATANDFITAIGEKSTKVPVETIRSAFNSFLEQPGIPYLHIEVNCKDDKSTLALTQSRYLPIGSKGSSQQSWEIPACIEYAIDGNQHEYCSVIDTPEFSIELPEAGCPDYVMPNSEGAGYYRFSMSGENWQSLLKHKDMLSTEDMISVNDSFSAAINAGKLNFLDLIEVAPEIIDTESPRVAMAPTDMLSFAYDKVANTEDDKAILASLNRELYQKKLDELGLVTRKEDSVDEVQMRNALVSFLADKGRDKNLRHYLTKMATDYTGYQKDNGLHPDKADSNVINTAMVVAVEDLGVPFAEHLLSQLNESNDGTVRGRMLAGLGSVQDSEYAAEIRELILSESLRDNEIYYILMGQMDDPKLQDAMWDWFKENIDGVKSRIPPFGQNRLPVIGNGFCSEEKKKDFVTFFEPIVEELPGAPRSFMQAVESIELCIAKVEQHSESVQQYIEQNANQ
ncbi:MAG TPA: M1 family metallopeptidase [Kangiella sp.]